jgi:hypothetical protein
LARRRHSTGRRPPPSPRPPRGVATSCLRREICWVAGPVRARLGSHDVSGRRNDSSQRQDEQGSPTAECRQYVFDVEINPDA